MSLVVAAAAVVLGRYCRSTLPVVAAWHSADEHEDRPTSDRSLLLTLPVDGDRTVGDLLVSVGEAFRNPENVYDQNAYERLVDRVGGRVAVGVVDGGVARPGDRVVPVTAPPYPVTLCPITSDGTTVLTMVARGEEVPPAVATTFLNAVAHVYAQLADSAKTLGSLALTGAAPGLRTADHEPEKRYDDRLTLHGTFGRIAAATPDRIAITDGDTAFTYAEVQARAGQIAAGLVGRGVVPGEHVGVCLERSADLVITMLAILEASAVYVPMDPDYPDERLSYVVDDAGIRTVVSTREAFPRADGLTVIEPSALASGGGPRPEPGTVKASEPAYVIYTSGSTGRPKGVVVSHRSVTALIDATRDDFALGEQDTWTLFHSSAFDFSVWEIWAPLLTGARLVVVPYWASRDPEEFLRLLVRERVTVLNQTPSAFAQLVEAEVRSGEPRLDRLRLVVFGGEALDPRRLLGWMDRYPESRCRLVNMYGITETTVHVTARTVTRAAALAGSRSVGRAIRGWTVDIRDERLRPVPAGFPGEIVVGGDGLAVHYLGRPDLTAQRFVTDPVTGRRLYRSGDLGRIGADGSLDHLGRIDRQVKIRGFRIELDEVRSVIEDMPGVLASAVLVGGDVDRDPASARLDAYVVIDGTAVATVRERIARLLPAYMMPSTITPLPSLPLTRNGKLDARALPDPLEAPDAPPGAPAAAASPRMVDAGAEDIADDVAENAVDQLEPMRSVWEAVLGVPVGFDDNFFELGGNSLLAVRLGATLRERGLPVPPLRSLYLRPTVRGLADDAIAAGSR